MSSKKRLENLEAEFELICSKVKEYSVKFFAEDGRPLNKAKAAAADREVQELFIALMKDYEKFNLEVIPPSKNREMILVSNRLFDNITILVNTNGIPYLIQKLYTEKQGFLPMQPIIIETFRKLKSLL